MSRDHVVPNNDLREHVVESDGLCPCLPRVLLPRAEQMPDGTWVQPDHSHARVVHNSYDRREVGEVCRKALDLLGCALADHGHDWGDGEREAYEHAIQLLDMHWPAKPQEPKVRKPWK